MNPSTSTSTNLVAPTLTAPYFVEKPGAVYIPRKHRENVKALATQSTVKNKFTATSNTATLTPAAATNRTFYRYALGTSFVLGVCLIVFVLWRLLKRVRSAAQLKDKVQCQQCQHFELLQESIDKECGLLLPNMEHVDTISLYSNKCECKCVSCHNNARLAADYVRWIRLIKIRSDRWKSYSIWKELLIEQRELVQVTGVFNSLEAFCTLIFDELETCWAELKILRKK